MKICTKCKKSKDLDNFPKGRNACKTCYAKQKADYQRTTRGKALHANVVLKYSQSPKGKIVKQKEYIKGRLRGWDLDYIKYNGRKRTLMERYGITVDDYNMLLSKQKGLCDVCGNPETATRKSRSGTVRLLQLSVDHNHKTGKVRGLLCSKCNLAIACLKENVEYMANAISYIEKHKNKTAELVMGT